MVIVTIDDVLIKKEKSEIDSMLNIAKYWHDISECDCDSLYPIGGCLKCDMEKIINSLTNIK